MNIETFWLIVILTASFILLLRHLGLLISQIIFAILVDQFIHSFLFTIAFISQILFGLWVAYRVFQAAAYHYQLEMEKTSRIPQHYTIESRSGRRKNFL
ncbi:hypothetical protein [Gracilibacillus massiliensis]|uniref:hypothetical protein n=1 Tax=Gracilibacillus massiliensis TaxID=1564956 RepID=UPI00071E6200|nr:hypothetical protein [Gracilibacillus massiliensis]